MLHPDDPSKIVIRPRTGNDSPRHAMAMLIERLRPGMAVVGVASVESLWSFLSGYAIARADAGDLRDLDYFNAFGAWVRRRYKLPAHDWGKILAFYSRNDAEGIELFWTVYDAFLGSLGPPRADPHGPSNGHPRHPANHSPRGSA